MESLEFASLIGLIYEAALEVDAWPAVLTEIGRCVGSSWLVLGLLRLGGGAELNVQDLAGDPSHLALFNAKFTAPDTNPAVRRLLSARPGAVILREEEMNDEEWRRHPLYREIYKPIGVYHGLGALVLRTPEHIAPIGMNRTREQGPFTPRDIGLLSQILPHLRQALEVALKIAELSGIKTGYEALWDRLPHGVILLNRERKVLWANEAAWSVLQGADGLDIHQGRLRAARHAENTALEQLVAATIVSPAAAIRGQGAVSITRPSLRRPYALLVAPVSMSALEFGRAPCAVVIVTDPEQGSNARPSRLAALFGLTPREGALAVLLMEGKDLDEIAEQLHVSRNTARQHLRSLFAKTATHRQAELVRLLLRSPAGLL